MNPITRARHKSIIFVGQHPSLFFPLVELRKRCGLNQGLTTVTRDTDLVIEGFLRCANSFATRAFLSAQPRKVKVANRTHAPATIMRAAQWGIPTLVLIRDPKDVIVSYMLKRPYITAADGFREFIDYYTRIAPYGEHYIVASFDQVTTDFGTVIERINSRFNTIFVPFRHEDQNVKRVFSVIEHNDRAQVGNDLSKISVPLAERGQIKSDMRARIETEELRPLITEAEQIYQGFVIRSTRASSGLVRA